MAVKFSQFNVGATVSDIDYIVGYKSTNNVQIPIGLVTANTTYSVATAQSGLNETLTLTGSDASTDVITFTAGANITLTDNGVGNGFTIQSKGSVDGSGTANYITKWIDADTIGDSVIYDNGTNVGIGTNNPVNGKLQIDSPSNQISISQPPANGRLNIGYFSNGSFIGTYGDDGGFGDIIRFGTHSGDERMRIHSGGDISFRDTSNNEAFYWDASTARLGIGTGSSPSSRLEISGATGSYDSGIGFNATGAGARVYRTFIDTSGTFRFDDVSAGFLTRLVINTSGNVGIGTTSPSGKLEIEDTTARTGTTASLIIEGRQDGATNVLTLRSKDFSAPTLGIGANHGPLMRWQGFGGTDFENMGYIFVGADGQTVATGDAPSYMSFGTSGDGSSSPTERMRIDSSGNVGIKGTGTKLGWERASDNSPNIVYLTKTQTISTNGEAKLHGYDGIIFTTSGSETERMTIDSNGQGYFNSAFRVGGLYITALQGNAQLTNASTSSGSNPSYIGQGLISVTISDEKSKENFGIVEENECLNEVVSLSKYVKKFDWIDEDWKAEKGRTIGMVAQEVEEEFSKYVHKPKNHEDDGWAIRYQEIVPTLIKAVQELKAEIETLKSQINN